MWLTRARMLGLALAGAGVAVAAGAMNASCAQTPTNVLVRTFELAQKVDVVCMQVIDANGNTMPVPAPAAEDNCAPVAVNANGAVLPYHLFAVVTQLARGELAVVDLTAGNVVDDDRVTPGTNFIPVGEIPTDVTVGPDAQMTFVASADPSKPAIYGIDNRRLLGDSPNVSGTPAPLALTDLFACALPQAPQGLATAKRADGTYVLVALLRGSAGGPAAVAAIDPTPLLAGAGLDGGEPDGGAPIAAGALPPCAVLGATAFSPGVPPSWAPGPVWADGVPYADGGVDLSDAEPSLGLACGAAGGDAGDGGIPVALGPASSPHPTQMAMRDDVPLLYVADDGLPVIHVIDLSDPNNPREAPPLLATSVLEPTRQVSVGALALSPPTRDYRRYLYAVDSKVGSVMVFDVTDPASTVRVPLQRPHRELNPFAQPDRLAFSAPVATLAFVEHDWPLPSPAEGSTPVHQYSGLLCNPNPYAHPDPNTFADKGAYFRADLASTIQTSGTVSGFPDRLRGVFAFVTLSNGTIVVIDVDDWDAPCRRPDPMSAESTVTDITGVQYDGPMNGVFGVLDVPQQGPDAGDLDPYHAALTYNAAIPESAGTTLEAFFPVSAPHRMRSLYLLRNDPTSGLHVPNLIAPALLFDINGAPLPTTGQQGLANPLMLPTPLPTGWADPSRTQNPTEADPSARKATIAALARAVDQATPPATSTNGSTASPLVPGANAVPADIRISFDDPTAHIDQDWTVTYEGAIPTVQGVTVDIASFDQYQTLTMAANYAPPDAGQEASTLGFCFRGIEDWSVGQQRANAVLQAIDAINKSLAGAPAGGDAGAGDAGGTSGDGGAPSGARLPMPGEGASGNPTLPQWTSDYVEIVDDLLVNTDPYWGLPSVQNGQPGNDCWDDPLADPPDNTASVSSHAQDRYNACFQTFDAAANADTHYARDFPIVEAYDNRLVLGRFGWLPNPPAGSADAGAATTVGEQPNNRVVVGPGKDSNNPPFLRFARCCFHHQASIKVRTGGEWVTNGSATGYLHHVVRDPATRRCVLSCDPADVLKNARTFDVPWSTPAAGCQSPPLPASLDRNSVLAMRNPMFSFVVWQGCTPLVANDHTETARDMQWRFSLRGGFTPLTIPLTQGTTSAVSPQSMRFIDSLGQLAVVDGAQQGLVLIDLNSLAFAHNPYF